MKRKRGPKSERRLACDRYTKLAMQEMVRAYRENPRRARRPSWRKAREEGAYTLLTRQGSGVI